MTSLKHLAIGAGLAAHCVLVQTAFAQLPKYDTPTVEVVSVSKTSMTFKITAGATGAPAGFALEWVDAATWYANYGWPPLGDPTLIYCDFTGTPTLNTTRGTSNFVLGPGEIAYVEMGDIFDETGLYANYDGELTPGVEYYIRVQAEGDAGGDASDYSPDIEAWTLAQSPSDCTYTQGYWKTHGPAGVWPVSGLTLGTVYYTNAQLVSILGTPAAGNGLIFLAHQLIAARLNEATGATVPISVLTAMNNADALIGGLVVPPVGGGYIAPGAASGLTQTLDDYNNGTLGPGHCGTVPAQSSTWGAIKSLYNK